MMYPVCTLQIGYGIYLICMRCQRRVSRLVSLRKTMWVRSVANFFYDTTCDLIQVFHNRPQILHHSFNFRRILREAFCPFIDKAYVSPTKFGQYINFPKNKFHIDNRWYISFDEALKLNLIKKK